MTLALRLGRTLDELGQQMTARELMLWTAFDKQSPIGDRRADIQHASTASAICQALGADVKLSGLVLDWDGGGEEAATDDDAFESLIAGLAG
ncbi:phage tail assembly protein T [Salinicola endophyticus]|nr:phage tail protein [Salinicola endophyticus]